RGEVVAVKRFLRIEVRAADDAVVLVRVIRVLVHDRSPSCDAVETGMRRAARLAECPTLGEARERTVTSPYEQLGALSASLGTTIAGRLRCFNAELSADSSVLLTRCHAAATVCSSLHVLANCARVAAVGALSPRSCALSCAASAPLIAEKVGGAFWPPRPRPRPRAASRPKIESTRAASAV